MGLVVICAPSPSINGGDGSTLEMFTGVPKHGMSSEAQPDNLALANKSFSNLIMIEIHQSGCFSTSKEHQKV